MMRSGLLAILVLFASCSSMREYVFVQMSDPQLGFREDSGFEKGYELLQTTVNEINAINPDLVIVTGDLTNSSRDKAQKEAYKSLIGKLSSRKVFHLPGNHDIKEANRESIQAFIDIYGSDRFFFLHKGSSFIGLNSNMIVFGDSLQRQEQLNFLVSSLEKSRNAKHKYVFMHYPIVTGSMNEPETYSNLSKENRKLVFDIVKEYGVEIVFAGHLHQNFECNLDGIRMVTCGPSGLPLGKGMSGFNVVRVKRDSTEVLYKSYNL